MKDNQAKKLNQTSPKTQTKEVVMNSTTPNLEPKPSNPEK
jgi:hypothetical protein